MSPPSTPRSPRRRWKKDRLDQVTRRLIGAAIEVDRRLGPGLLEPAYETCLPFELEQLGFRIKRRRTLPIVYKNVKLDCGYRLDIGVEKAIMVEVKAIDQLAPIHDAQLLSYLCISGLKVDLLMNFHVRVLKDGLKRMVNEFPDAATSAVTF